MLSSTVSLPSGVAMPVEDRLDVAQRLNQYGCWLLENDSLGELSLDAAPAPLRDLVNPERLIVFSSFEKTLGSEAPMAIC